MASTDQAVVNIITAFTSGNDIFKKLRTRKRKRRGVSREDEAAERKERELARSLRQGPLAIEKQYNQYAEYAGQQYTQGDAIAHSALATTLVKLNSGLVAIIASFLACGKPDLAINYRSLTELSDNSTFETLDALGKLYHRVSMSSLNLAPPPSYQKSIESSYAPCEYSEHGEPCMYPRHMPVMPLPEQDSRTQNKSPKRKSPKKDKDSSAKSSTTKCSSSPKKSAVSQDDIQVMRRTISSEKDAQLALVRPRTRRRANSSTADSKAPSSVSRSTASSGISTPPRTSPLPSPIALKSYPFPPPAVAQYMEKPLTPPLSPDLSSVHPALRPHKKKLNFASPPLTPTILEDCVADNYEHSIPFGTQVIPRRLDKATPSIHSFASGSTRLGEIPMSKWTVPFDYEEAEKLNAEWQPTFPVDVREKQRSRFAWLWRGKD